MVTGTDADSPDPGKILGTRQPTTNKTKKETVNQSSVWDKAPNVPLIPFLDAEQRATLVNQKATVQLMDMIYDRTGSFGDRFVATILVPAGIVDEESGTYKFGMKSSMGQSPRDHTNKFLMSQLKGGSGPIECQLIKQGRAYLLAQPGSDTETDGYWDADAVGSTEEPPF